MPYYSRSRQLVTEPSGESHVEQWIARLNAGESQASWDLFHNRYRRLILATIRRLIPDHDDVMDLFSSVCQVLVADDFARLRRYAEQSSSRDSAATWLVVVVRNLTIDFLRQRDGRRRLSMPPGLSPFQLEIYSEVCVEKRSYIEAYEQIRSRSTALMGFTDFLREVRTTHHLAPCPDQAPRRRPVREVLPADAVTIDREPADADSWKRLATALASQPPDVRLAVELFVIDDLPAADVARLVGWPNAKAVYNRVARALASMRAKFEAQGLGPDDLR